VSTDRPRQAKCALMAIGDEGAFRVYLAGNLVPSRPDYVFTNKDVPAQDGQFAWVTHLRNGEVILALAEGEEAYELGQLPWLNEPKPAQPEQPKRPNETKGVLMAAAHDDGFHVYLDGNTDLSKPDYTFTDKNVPAHTGQLAWVSRRPGHVILTFVTSVAPYDLGDIPWLNEPKPGQPEPVDPALFCAPEDAWLAIRALVLVKAIQRQIDTPGKCDWKLLADRAEQLTRHAEWLGHWHP